MKTYTEKVVVRLTKAEKARLSNMGKCMGGMSGAVRFLLRNYKVEAVRTHICGTTQGYVDDQEHKLRDHIADRRSRIRGTLF